MLVLEKYRVDFLMGNIRKEVAVVVLKRNVATVRAENLMVKPSFLSTEKCGRKIHEVLDTELVL